ncbi:pyridoxal phosphate-dependent aminotransferase [Aureimonas sp. AU12]|uniref:pyridoxal phosphate-dependent aminotransferase n=1 Tax=Aureimonas sp. AU12 TaxID=1638161 RepID=UPI000784FDB3|nr:aminotransferase class I/II-fold pyridoxal phosphate-dependent enzyme [Aureimonas sp. AU12]
MYDIRPIKASRRSAIDPFRAMDVLAEANRMIAAGQPVISLAVGQPSAPVPKPAADATRRFLDVGHVGYTDALGRVDLRSRIAHHYADTYACHVGIDRIMVTTGSSAGFNLAFLAAFDVGDRVAIATPGYPAYRNILKALGIIPVEIPVDSSDGYILTADRLAACHREAPIQGVLVASPANPTGTVTPREELRRLVEFADRETITFISDEIYHGLVYGEPAASALEFSSRPIVVNSFSKYYCMTGWRVGWLVLPPSLVRAAERIGQSLYISAPELSQVAAAAVFDAGDELEAVKADYVRNRAMVTDALPKLGFADVAPIDGAFYAYAGIPEGYGDASELARTILAQCHVAMTPGIDFDPERGERTMRLSYAGHPDAIREALDRLAAFFG